MKPSTMAKLDKISSSETTKQLMRSEMEQSEEKPANSIPLSSNLQNQNPFSFLLLEKLLAKQSVRICGSELKQSITMAMSGLEYPNLSPPVIPSRFSPSMAII